MYTAAVAQKQGSDMQLKCEAVRRSGKLTIGLTVYSITVTITISFVDDEVDAKYISFSSEGLVVAKK